MLKNKNKTYFCSNSFAGSASSGLASWEIALIVVAILLVIVIILAFVIRAVYKSRSAKSYESAGGSEKVKMNGGYQADEKV